MAGTGCLAECSCELCGVSACAASIISWATRRPTAIARRVSNAPSSLFQTVPLRAWA